MKQLATALCLACAATAFASVELYGHHSASEAVFSEYDETEYEYDSFLKTAESSDGFRADFEYDDDFRLSKTTYASDWLNEGSALAEIDVAYDDDGDVVGIGDLRILRNPATGFVEATGLGNVVDWRNYNGYGECTNYVASFEGDDLYCASLKRDALGRVVEREERVLDGDAVTSRYEYDVRGRLVSVTTNGVVSESYAYDANGNRLGGEYDAQDRQLAFGSATNAYDLNGSMTNRNGVALTWNLFGRLMSVDGVSYWRDEHQRICSKSIDGDLVKDWYWSGSRIVAEYDYASDETSVFIYVGATAPAYMVRNGVTYRIITDNQGSVRLVVNSETGEVAQRLDYDSFGRVLCDTNPGFQPFGFQGGLGLVEFGCRWYDAETGRWISKDPIGLRGGLNLYEFCEGCPTVFSDPLGFSRVIISMVDGSKQTLRNPSLDDFRNAIKGCADGSIMALTIYDHGTFNSMDINGEGDGVVINPVDNSVRFTDNNTLLSGLLGPKMANGGTVLLSGCRTADYRNALDRVCKWVCDWLNGAESEDPCPEWLNISKALSMELPSIKVVGNRTYALGNKYGPTWNIGWRRSYVNGK